MCRGTYSSARTIPEAAKTTDLIYSLPPPQWLATFFSQRTLWNKGWVVRIIACIPLSFQIIFFVITSFHFKGSPMWWESRAATVISISQTRKSRSGSRRLAQVTHLCSRDAAGLQSPLFLIKSFFHAILCSPWNARQCFSVFSNEQQKHPQYPDI